MKLNKLLLCALSVGICGVSQAATVKSTIPLKLTIPKLCTIDNQAGTVLVPSDGSNVSASYTVTCNTGYTISTMTDNYLTSDWATHLKSSAGNYLVTGMGTTGPGGTSVGIQHAAGVSFPGSSVDTFTMSVSLQNAITPTTTAGTYRDNYRITVTY